MNIMRYARRFFFMEKRLFGKLPSGEEVYLYTLVSGEAVAEVITYGAAIRSFKPFGEVDIIGGFDSFDDYLADTSHQGATIGRVANRVGGAQFTMDGAIYMLPDNNHGNCLHGGDGFDHRIWTAEDVTDESIRLSYYSPDGEEGFPSGLKCEVSFTLSGGTLIISYKAVPEGKTPIALTNHSYFNLDGFGGNIEKHRAKIYADRYTEVNELLIPNGNRPDVVGTPFDFHDFHEIGERCGEEFIGYDHNMVLSPTIYKEFLGVEAGLAAIVENGKMRMSVYTDQPGVQFYIGNFLGDGRSFKGGVKPVFHGAFCLETQTEPDCVNHGEGFYDAGEVYKHITVYEIEKI